jgi:hypothetical protein
MNGANFTCIAYFAASSALISAIRARVSPRVSNARKSSRIAVLVRGLTVLAHIDRARLVRRDGNIAACSHERIV